MKGHMQAELAQRLVKEIKEKLPAVDITAEEAALISIITLSTMAGFAHELGHHNKGKLIRYVRETVESFLKGVTLV